MESVRRISVEDDWYFTQIVHYIHANAVQHGICQKIEDCKYSSYHALISDKPTLLKREELLDWFGGLDRFIQFHQQPIYLKLKEDFEV